MLFIYFMTHRVGDDNAPKAMRKYLLKRGMKTYTCHGTIDAFLTVENHNKRNVMCYMPIVVVWIFGTFTGLVYMTVYVHFMRVIRPYWCTTPSPFQTRR
jgi:hypothetical protein